MTRRIITYLRSTPKTQQSHHTLQQDQLSPRGIQTSGPEKGRAETCTVMAGEKKPDRLRDPRKLRDRLIRTPEFTRVMESVRKLRRLSIQYDNANKDLSSRQKIHQQFMAGITDPQAGRGPGITDPEAGRGPGITDPQAGRGPGINDPEAGRGPGITDPQAGRGPGINDPEAGRGPGITDPQAGRGPGINDPEAGRGPGITDPQAGRGPGINDPEAGRGPGITDPQAGRGPGITDSQAGRGEEGLNDPSHDTGGASKGMFQKEMSPDREDALLAAIRIITYLRSTPKTQQSHHTLQQDQLSPRGIQTSGPEKGRAETCTVMAGEKKPDRLRDPRKLRDCLI
eukprot:sb/3466420/